MKLSVPLAIVGTACRLPGAQTPAELFELSARGGDALSDCPPEWAQQLGTTRALRAGRLQALPFDWKTFRIPPNQAQTLHRMEQVLISVLADALVDAGHAPQGPALKQCAVYVAATGLGVDLNIDHSLRVRSTEVTDVLAQVLGEPADGRLLTAVTEAVSARAPPVSADSLSTTASISAGRISGIFDTWGGHLAVDAGAASSLAALQLASRALYAGGVDTVVVGANSPLLSPSVFAALQARGWLSAGELCCLDAAADGTLPGEGAAAVVLRRLEDARRDGQRVLAVLHAVTDCSGPSLSVARLSRWVERAARLAMDRAGVEPDDVAHVEAQAAGIVSLEDEELWGLRSAFSARRGSPLTVSSAAGNTGFLQAASGLVSLVRAVESLGRGVRPPVARLRQPRVLPQGVEVLAQARALPENALVGISSLGATGSAYFALLGRPARRDPPPARAGRARRQKLAIVGVGAVAPGARDAATLWRNVLGKAEAIGDLPASRFDAVRLLRPLVEQGAVVPRLAGVVEPPAASPAWRMPPVAAGRQDAAVLLTLQAGEEAVLAAGYAQGLWDSRRVAVVIGQLPVRHREVDLERRFVCARYLAIAREALGAAGVEPERVDRLLAEARERYLAGLTPLCEETIGYTSGVACAARLAARFEFSGGALSVDAACASAMAAVHAGALALYTHQADVVVAGGVAWNLVPEYYVALSALGLLSARGSFPFDDRADGFVPGEGAGAVVLKRLEDAEAARDRILAVVAGIGASSDGRGHSLYAPSPDGLARAVVRAQEDAQVTPDWVDLVEAHGTGSRKSDLCEAAAYARVFADRGRDNPVAMGSLKSQLGHLSSAGGAVALIKATFALCERVLPPMNGGEYPNPEVGFEKVPLALSLEPRPWRLPQSGVRRAGVSSFGLGGTNYHLVLEEHDNIHLRDRQVDPSPATRPHPVPARGLFADRWVVDLAPVSLAGAGRYPLAKKRFVVLGTALASQLAQALETRGAKAVTLDVTGIADPLEVQRRVEGAVDGLGGVEGVVDCGAFGPLPYFLGQGAQWCREQVQQSSARWFGAARATYGRLRAAGRAGSFTAITSMGGDFGFLGDGGNVLGGASAGFLKALKQEMPDLVAKCVDFAPDAGLDEVVQRTLAELEDGSDRVEAGYLCGRRVVPLVRRANHPASETVRRAIDPAWVLVFSGGGRGAVYEVAKGMARLGPRVVVTGRTPLPQGDEPWLNLDAEAFESYRREQMVRRKAQDPTLTPVKFNREFDALVRARELWGNLQEIFALGLPIEYAVCDVRDRAEVEALVVRVRETYGRVDGIVHGAMIEGSKSLPDKSPDLVQATLEVKVQGLVNLLEATAPDALQLVMCFGSGAGRFGNRGQTDYAAANDLMSKCLMSFAHRARPQARCVTIDWTAWDEVGAAVRTRHMVAQTGVSSISPTEGIFWFINELMQGGREREVAIFEERLFHDWPFLGSSAEGPGGHAVYDDRGQLLVPSDYPLVEFVERRTPKELVAVRDFDLAKDRFLHQHQLYGVPILPGTFGMELLAEGASLLRPELTVLQGYDIEIDAPLKLHRPGPVPVQVLARVVEDHGDKVVVAVEATSTFRLGQSAVQRERLHIRGFFVLGPAAPPPSGDGQLPASFPGARARSIFHLARDPVYLGPLFCRAEWVYVGEKTVEGILRAPRQREIFTHLTRPHFQIDPLMLDTAFQVAANWDGHHHGLVSIPMGVAELMRGRARRINEGAHVRVQPVQVHGKDVLYDVQVYGEDGTMLLEVRRLWLRRLDATAAAEP
jgi:enediyne polyketide synthase